MFVSIDSVCNDCLEEYASEAYNEYLEGYVERTTVCGVLITEFIFNVISGILLYNNFNNKILGWTNKKKVKSVCVTEKKY